MTRARVHAVGAGYEALGARFHPGMARAFLGIPGNELTDRSPELSALWGARGERLARRIGAADDAREAMSLLEEGLVPGREDSNGARQMTLWVVERGGRVRVDDLARYAGLSQRHLRRVFLERTGLTPKMFCRVVRFRAWCRGWSRGMETLAGLSGRWNWAITTRATWRTNSAN